MSKAPDSAVAVWKPGAVQLAELLPQGLTEDKVNLLVPSMAIRQVNPFLVPDVEMVKLDTSQTSKDIYHSNDMKAGEFAPTARALSKIANVAGVDVLDSRRIDNGKDPDVVEWRVVIQMRLPSAQLVTRAGTKRIDLHQLGEKQSPQWLGKMRENLVALAETKAFNRALRSMLSLQGAMPRAAFDKPFAIVRWVPNMNDPDVRARALDNLLPAVNVAYGPGTPAQQGILQIASGAALPADVEEVSDDDEDEAVDGDYTTTPEGYVADANGEVVSEPPAEPDWFEEKASEQLIQILRKALGTRPSRAALTQARRDQLRELFAGVDTQLIIAGLKVAFEFEGTRPADLADSQAAAIIESASALGREAFLEQWKGMAQA